MSSSNGASPPRVPLEGIPQLTVHPPATEEEVRRVADAYAARELYGSLAGVVRELRMSGARSPSRQRPMSPGAALQSPPPLAAPGDALGAAIERWISQRSDDISSPQPPDAPPPDRPPPLTPAPLAFLPPPAQAPAAAAVPLRLPDPPEAREPPAGRPRALARGAAACHAAAGAAAVLRLRRWSAWRRYAEQRQTERSSQDYWRRQLREQEQVCANLRARAHAAERELAAARAAPPGDAAAGLHILGGLRRRQQARRADPAQLSPEQAELAVLPLAAAPPAPANGSGPPAPPPAAGAGLAQPASGLELAAAVDLEIADQGSDAPPPLSPKAVRFGPPLRDEGSSPRDAAEQDDDGLQEVLRSFWCVCRDETASRQAAAQCFAQTVKHVLAAVLPSKDLEEVLQAELWGLPCPGHAEGRSRGERTASPEAEAKHVALAAETGGGGSKFDASDQVRGHVATGEEAKYERAPEKIAFYPRNYRPPHDALQTVHGLRRWHDPRGRMWPNEAIDRLQRNCALMVEKHAHGEPRSVVVPLFAYSTFMFKPQVWALWVPVDAAGGGRWHIVPERDDLERYFDSFWRDFRPAAASAGMCSVRSRPRSRSARFSSIDTGASELRLGDASRTVRSLMDGALGAAAHLVDPDKAYGWAPPGDEPQVDVPDHLDPVLIHGSSQLGCLDLTARANWAGLTMWAGGTVEWKFATGSAHEASSAARTISDVHAVDAASSEHSEGSGSESDTSGSGYSMDQRADAYLVRYSTPHERLGTPLNPLADCTIWLPPPSVMLAGGAGKPVWFRALRGGGFVTRDSSVRSPSLEDTQTRPGRPLMQMDFLPPPGLLEYVHSRRSDEPLRQLRPQQQRHDSADAAAGSATTPRSRTLFFVSKADIASQDLIDRCHKERNQQQYNASLHQMLRLFLKKAREGRSGTLRTGINGDMLTQLVQIKTGANPLREGSRPTPINIAHSLDLQELHWEGSPWIVAFSGEPFVLATNQLGVVPLFRCQHAFEDQPYWHLNQAARNLQFGKNCGSLHIKPFSQIQRKMPREERGLWDSLAGTYNAPVPELIGLGLHFLSAVATMNNSMERAKRFDMLRQRAWQMTLRRSPPDAGRCRSIRAAWVSEREQAWRATDEATYWEELRAPYEESDRALPGGTWWVTCNIIGTDGPRESGKRGGTSPRHVSRVGPVRGPSAAGGAANSGGLRSIVLDPNDYWLDAGTWMLEQVRPLLFHIEHAMTVMRPLVGPWRCAPERTLKLYRGLANVSLDSRVYARGKVILWGQYSSSSKDQGVAQSFAGGNRASVFTLEGFSCRLIAPWSRFGREEEWLFPLNTLWQLITLLTEEQQQILGKSGLQLYEMTEVDNDTMYLIQVRSVLQKASTAAAASIIFQSEAALKSGAILNLSLRSVDEGHTPPTWSYTVKVVYDGGGRCPLQTSTQWTDCEFEDAEALCYTMGSNRRAAGASESPAEPGGSRYGGEPARSRASSMISNLDTSASRAAGRQGSVMGRAEEKEDAGVQDDGETVYNASSSEGVAVLQRIAKVLKISRPEMAKLKSESQDIIEIHVQDNSARWEIDVALRKRAGRIGNAVKDEGAELLAAIILRGVPLSYIDLRNNGIQLAGARNILAAIRTNPKVLSCLVADAGAPPQLPPMECLRLDELRRNLHSNKRLLSDGLPTMTFDTTVQAINLRCMQHQGRVTVDRLAAFGPGWPLTFACALHDRQELDVDFAGLFSSDREAGTHRTEEAIMLLAEQCLVHAHANKSPVAFPHLPGALIAAANYAPVVLVRLLLDMGARVQDIDDYGETAYLKACRRGKLASHVQLLYTPQSHINILTCPFESEDETTRWRLKKFALEMVRMWDSKQTSEGAIVRIWEHEYGWRRGGGVLDELLYNFSIRSELKDLGPLLRMRQVVRQMCPLVRMRKLAERILQGSRASSLARIPVGRVGLTLLCCRFFVSTPELTCEDLGNKPATDSGDSLRQDLEQAALTLYDPTIFGQRSEQPEARETLSKWAGFWALLNCVLTATTEQEAFLAREVEDLPGSAFASFLRLKKGSIYACPAPSLWRSVKDPPPSEDPDAPPFTRVRLVATGRCHYEDVTPLLEGTTKKAPRVYLMPALSTFVVDDVSFEQGGWLCVKLISRGCLLESDPELRRWRGRVLEQAERAEEGLGIGKEAEERDITTRLRAQQEVRSTRTQLERERHTRRARADAERRRRESGVVTTFYSSHRNSMKARHIVTKVFDDIVNGMAECNSFAFTAIKDPERLPTRVWNNGDHGLHERKAFRYMMRPACTLLHLLDRVPDRVPDFSKHLLRRVELTKPLLDRTDFAREIAVSADAIDKYLADCKRRHERDEAFDTFVASRCVDGAEGPSPAMVFGSGVFRITISELQQCVRSTQLQTSGNLPNLFILDFIRRFAMSKDLAWFVRATRAVPLSAIIDDRRWRDQLQQVLELHRGQIALAGERIRDAEGKLQEFKGNPDKEAFQRMRIHNNTNIIAGVSEELELLQQDGDVADARTQLRLWREQVTQNSLWWGFSSSRQVEYVFAKSLVELSTEMCVSQKGYFLTDGVGGRHNQICPKTKNPVVFLSSPGIDFCFALPTRLEASKYFLRDPEKANGKLHLGWHAWRHGGEKNLHHRIKELYRTIFTSAQRQGVRNPSMLPLGLGVFLMNLQDFDCSRHLAHKVKECYFRAQFELLCEQDWGFETYYLNAQQHLGLAKEILEGEIRDKGDYNMPSDGLSLRCNIVFHDRDAKFLAQELAGQDMAPAFLNPSDSQAVIHGLLGMYWEVGRGASYVGEEDWAATSTGALGSFSVSRSAIGLDDVVLQLQDGGMLYVHKIFGAVGFLCTVSRSASTGIVADQDSATFGPFTAVTYDLAQRHLTTMSLAAVQSADAAQATQELSRTWKLAPIAKDSLRQLIQRVEQLAQCAAHKRPPLGLSAFRAGAQAAMIAYRMKRSPRHADDWAVPAKPHSPTLESPRSGYAESRSEEDEHSGSSAASATALRIAQGPRG